MEKIILIILLSLNAMLGYSQLNISGRIVSTDSQAIDAAYICVTDSSNLFAKNTLSENDGKFNFQNLPTGKYSLYVSSLGFEPITVSIQETTGKIELGNLILIANTAHLQEIVVEGKQVIQKNDNETYLPTQFQKRVSNNGIELLSSLSIRGVYVNPINMMIQKMNGGSIQLRINNIRVDIYRIMSLRPEKILRIEYYDSPTAAYGEEGVDAIINYVTAHAEFGGYVYADLSGAVTTGYSNNTLSAAYNTKSSEFELDYFLGYRDYDKTKDDGRDLFHYPTETNYERTRNALNQPYSYRQHVIMASYQLQSQNNYVLNVLFKSEMVPNHLDNRAWIETNSLNNNQLFTKRTSSSPYNRPVLDVYFQKKLNENQEFALNVVGTLWDEKNTTTFSQTENENQILNYQTLTEGNKKSAIFEGAYSNKLNENGKLSAGIRHLQGYSDNIYTGSSNANTTMNQANTYLFGEFSFKISKLSYSLGVGLNRSYFSESNNGFTYYNFRPSVSLKYIIDNNSAITNRFRVLTNNPSLSQLSNVEIAVDSIQISRGNPNLKSYYSYTNALSYNFNKKIISFSTELNYQYRKKPIMENFYYDMGKIVRSSKNQKNWDQLRVESQISVGTLWDILRCSLGGGVQSQHSNGDEYSHQLVSYYGFSTVSAFYKGFSFSGNFKTKTKSLWGESYSYIAPDITLQLQYTKNNQWSVGINAWNPFFSSLRNQFEIKSAQTHQLRTITYGDNGNLFSVRFAYMLSLGRRYNTVNKSLNNSDTDSGIMK